MFPLNNSLANTPHHSNRSCGTYSVRARGGHPQMLNQPGKGLRVTNNNLAVFHGGFFRTTRTDTARSRRLDIARAYPTSSRTTMQLVEDDSLQKRQGLTFQKYQGFLLSKFSLRPLKIMFQAGPLGAHGRPAPAMLPDHIARPLGFSGLLS